MLHYYKNPLKQTNKQKRATFEMGKVLILGANCYPHIKGQNKKKKSQSLSHNPRNNKEKNIDIRWYLPLGREHLGSQDHQWKTYIHTNMCVSGQFLIYGPQWNLRLRRKPGAIWKVKSYYVPIIIIISLPFLDIFFYLQFTFCWI